jgi:hypothetical protein
MRFVRRLAILALTLSLSLVVLGDAPADVAAPNKVAFDVTDSGIRIVWNASCGEPDYWAVNVLITHVSDNRKAAGDGYKYDNQNGQRPSASQDMHWQVLLSRGLAYEKFHAQVTLRCPDKNTIPEEVIGSQDFTLTKPIEVRKPKLNKRNGTARVPVSVPAPGTISLRGKGVRAQRNGRSSGAVASKRVAAPGIVNLLVKAKGKAKRRLTKTGKVRVKINVTYTPTGGATSTKTKQITLIKRRT